MVGRGRIKNTFMSQPGRYLFSDAGETHRGCPRSENRCHPGWLGKRNLREIKRNVFYLAMSQSSMFDTLSINLMSTFLGRNGHWEMARTFGSKSRTEIKDF